MRQRKGSFLLVITFGVLMAWVIVSMLTVATSLYSSSKDTAKIYGDIQSYRAATELACYQYITDLQGMTVTKDLDGDWISVSGQAVYTQALDAIQATLASPEDPTAWFVTDITDALAGANLSDPSVLTDLLSKLSGVRQEFKLTVPEPMKLDWDNPETSSSRTGATVALEPLVIEVYLTVKGESVSEKFIVTDLFLDVDITETEMEDGSTHAVATMMLTEKESGVTISREPITVT